MQPKKRLTDAQEIAFAYEETYGEEPEVAACVGQTGVVKVWVCSSNITTILATQHNGHVLWHGVWPSVMRDAVKQHQERYQIAPDEEKE